MENETKAGYKTTEFWVTILLAALNFAVSVGLITSDQASTWAALVPTIATMIVAVVYTVSRWYLKS